MDRVRIGLTGLASVLLVTLVASLLSATGPLMQTAGQPTRTGELLGQLGITPGSDSATRDNSDTPPVDERELLSHDVQSRHGRESTPIISNDSQIARNVEDSARYV